MNFISSNETIENNSYSVLAIVETIIAVVLSVYIAYSNETLIFILVGALVTPMLLLRTHISTEFGVGIFKKVSHFVNTKIVFNVFPAISAILSFFYGFYMVFDVWDSTFAKIDYTLISFF